MSSFGFILDVRDITNILDKYSKKENNTRAINFALEQGAKVLRQEAQKQLVRRVPGMGADEAGSRRRAAYHMGKPTSSKVLYSRHEDELRVNINIMGDYRLPMFEGGTQRRFTKGKGEKRRYDPGIYRGVIRSTYFFSDATSASEDKVVNRIFDSLDEYFMPF